MLSIIQTSNIPKLFFVLFCFVKGTVFGKGAANKFRPWRKMEHKFYIF